MKVTIGFEIHEQLNTPTKLYCDSPTNYREVPPNTNVCEVCTGMPGSKPMPVNRDAIDAAVEIALMLDCEIIKEPIYIQRKHYDYPDLPSGYQRTSLPIAKDGELNGVGIWEVHLEEDPGKYDPVTGKVDYNRSGVPLVEIVTAPDITSPEEARGFMRELTKVLQYTGKVRPEGGTMRMDTNISLEGGARVEIKNINSVRGAYKALKFEMTRQRSLMKRGVKVKRETRAFLEAQMITKRMRVKEEAEDYRYIPDPDIPPLLITEDKITEIRAEMPEPPHMKLKRFIKDYNIPRDDAWAITSEIEMADTFEEVCRAMDPKFAASVFRHEIKRVLTFRNMSFRESGLNSDRIVELLNMTTQGEITKKAEKKVFEKLIGTSESPREIVEELGLVRIKEEDVVEKAVEEAVRENPKAVEDYLKGKEEALHYVVGQVMKKTKGRADPNTVLEKLKEKLE
ncbi:MAG: Asp-tRNA(Asn)/Glu-tRNA(Gln) amidotransferase subunit GatB [Candidatus Hydrothermarchaeales archaeon]